jgi:hypothetical protein
MTNQERLQEYLVGNNGYLKNDISNGKVIMLSGKWGSGKTHFWKNIIEKELIENQTKKQKAYVYSSLYGNRTLDKIEDNIYAQAYLCSVGGKNAVLSGYEKVKDFGKRFGSFCSLLDVSKLVDGIDDIQQKNIKKSALSYLENGGIVCFDDFERKSKEIDLNDLFGFISHLAIDLNCKVVIILNDDVFEGEEKKIFSNVKEKSVSKFLKYEPSIEELFHSIYEKHGIFKSYPKWEETILKYIEESQILNARIYTQVLDNILEFFNNTNDEYKGKNEVLRCLILVNINYILYHTIFYRKVASSDGYIHNLRDFEFTGFDYWTDNSSNGRINHSPNFEHYIMKIKNKRYGAREKKDEEIKNLINFIDENINLFKSNYFANKLDISKNVDNDIFQKINNFIETGILINE